MLENIKLDVIYYGTQKDFEMEFNLCGCCRMRLLTSTAEDLKGFVNCIKVAVARSRVVLLCGELYGETGLLNIISKAVGRDFEEVENTIYGIAGNGKTSLLKQSIPLVTSSGKLLGCVIEQGPQAIIMISDDKDGRKEIMQNLVHPYIKELSKSENGAATDSVFENAEDESNVFVSPEPEVLEEPCETEEDISEIESQTEEIEQSADENDEDEEELVTVSLEDFGAEGEQADEISDETESEADALTEDTAADDTNEAATDNDADLPDDSGLVFDEGEEAEDETDETVFTSDVFKQYNDTFSLITPVADKNKRYKHGRSSGNSPILLILFCLVLCLLAVIIYFLLVKPAQAGIDIGENFSNLFSFALKGVNRIW